MQVGHARGRSHYRSNRYKAYTPSAAPTRALGRLRFGFAGIGHLVANHMWS